MYNYVSICTCTVCIYFKINFILYLISSATALRRFRQSLKRCVLFQMVSIFILLSLALFSYSLTHCDEVLYHLLSFSSVSDYYKFPQSILDGMPLLTIPPNQSKPVLAINTDGEDK